MDRCQHVGYWIPALFLQCGVRTNLLDPHMSGMALSQVICSMCGAKATLKDCGDRVEYHELKRKPEVI